MKKLCFAILLILSSLSFAGVDIAGPVQRVQLAPDGKLWFTMETTSAATYCKPGWFSLTMYIPRDHPDFAYYFAMLLSATAKGKSVYIANISAFDGSGPCDITKTGYGLVVLQ
ncbi:MAG: hypothetical protein K2Q15_03530 [Burkholderiales bacterium]|nr:hypothetical protein [Burkholderiales bacterium]